MVELSRRFKLEYTDSSGTVQTIAENGQNTGALQIDRWVHIRNKNDPDILKIWLEGDNFGSSIPTRKNEFGTASNETNEPEIRYKQYNPDTDSFITRNRFYPKNKGTIDEQGRLAWKLYSFMKYTARQSVSFSPVSTDVESALNNTLPSGYIADVPSGITPPSVNAYSLNARREKGYQELTRNYKYALTFTSNLDGSNNAQVKYEPEGFGGTIDTLVSNEQAGSYKIIAVDTTNEIFTVSGDVTDLFAVNQSILIDGSTGNDGTYTISALNYDSTNNETDITVDEDVTSSTADGRIIPGGQAIFKAWEKDKTEAIINKVTVEGTNSNGVTITGTATNQAQLDNFGEKFLKVKVGYLEDQAEAEEIAKRYLVPGKDENGNDITKVPESGTLKTTIYSDNIVNDSVQVVDNTRSIDDTYTVVQQRNYWPEGASELELEFEKENLEKAAREAENLRDERARLYPNQQQDVGNQVVDADTEDVTDQYDSHNSNQHPHDVAGEQTTAGGGAAASVSQDLFDSNFSIPANSTGTITTANVGTVDQQAALYYITFRINPDRTPTTASEIQALAPTIRIRQDVSGFTQYYPTQTGQVLYSTAASPENEDFWNTVNHEVTIKVPNVFNDSTEEVQIETGGTPIEGIINVSRVGEEEHEHSVPFISDRATDRSDGSTNDTNPSDSNAGDTTSLNADGSTDAKNINVAKENKTDR